MGANETYRYTENQDFKVLLQAHPGNTLSPTNSKQDTNNVVFSLWMKTDLTLKFKKNLFSKIIWSSTFKLLIILMNR